MTALGVSAADAAAYADRILAWRSSAEPGQNLDIELIDEQERHRRPSPGPGADLRPARFEGGYRFATPLLGVSALKRPCSWASRSRVVAGRIEA